jgi:FkbM family methyltransferase
MNKSFLWFIGKRLRPPELALLVKFLFRIKRRQVTVPDGRVYFVDPASDFGLSLLNSESYEKEMTHAIQSILGEGDTFIDIGSNEGFFSILASKIFGPAGHVYSIEPQQRLWEILMKNISLNNCFNTQLLPLGIGSAEQTLTLNLYSTLNTGASSFGKDYNFKVSFAGARKWLYGHQTVKVKPLDEIAKIFPERIKLIKIDVEGFEFEVLKGMTLILNSQRIDHLLIEIHEYALMQLGETEKSITNFLTGYGYLESKVSGNLNLYSRKA